MRKPHAEKSLTASDEASGLALKLPSASQSIICRLLVVETLNPQARLPLRVKFRLARERENLMFSPQAKKPAGSPPEVLSWASQSSTRTLRQMTISMPTTLNCTPLGCGL